MRSPGSYMATPDGRAQDDELVFWGEWEPQSDVAPISSPVTAGPQWLHNPYYVRPTAYSGDGWGLQNTDPFAFGDRFLYTLCKQIQKRTLRNGTRAWRPTVMRDLAPGSLVLFGAPKPKEKAFLLDTVFVVGEGEGMLHTPARWPNLLTSGRISDTYADVTMRAGCDWDYGVELRLYEGATPESPVGEMFSFAPCSPATDPVRGFRRPVIQLNQKFNGKRIFTPTLPMGLKSTCAVPLETLTELWRDVVTQVTERDGLELGIRFALPPARDA